MKKLALLSILLLCCGGEGGRGAFCTETVSTDVCQSGKRWTCGNEGSSQMRPGGDCIGCHSQGREGPRYTAAGTVMGSFSDADDCVGIAGANVVITDANGKVVTLTSNSVGNFYTNVTLAMPFHAQVTTDAGVRAMSAAQTSGACATCHTQTGAQNAPGRVINP